MQNDNLKFKIAFIFVLYRTPIDEVKRLKKEISLMRFDNCKIYFINNSDDNKGYAYGVNRGLRKAIEDGANLFIVANPDISLKNLKAKDLLAAAYHFDIGGFAFDQKNKIYYGGEIDKWRMSGGLIDEKPSQRYVERDFVSGSLMIIKKEVVDKIGFFDEEYFMYYEDVDFCFRAKKAGFKVGIDSRLVYKHFENATNNFKKEHYLYKNRLRLLLKYGNLQQKFYELIRSPKSIIENLKKSNNIRNFFSLNFSSFLNRMFSFVLFIFLVRYLSPKDYGIYTLVWAHIGILAPFLDFGTTTYGLIFSANEQNKKFSSLFSLRIFLSICVFILTIILALLLKYNKSIINYIFLISFVIFANNFSGSFLIFSAVKGKLILPSLVSIIFNLLMSLSLILVLIIFRNFSLIFFTIFCFYNLYSLINVYLIKREIKTLEINLFFKEWIKILKKSVVFLLISFFAGLYNKIDIFLLNFLKSPKEVGIYSSGYKFYDALIFLAASYNVISMPIFSRLTNNKELLIKKIKKDVFFLSSFGFLTAFVFVVLSPFILPLILKGDFSKSILVAQIVIFSLPLVLLTSVFLNVIYAFNKTYLVVYTFILTTIFNLVFNYLFIPKYSYLASACLTVFGEIINLVILFIIIKKFILKKT